MRRVIAESGLGARGWGRPSVRWRLLGQKRKWTAQFEATGTVGVECRTTVHLSFIAQKTDLLRHKVLFIAAAL
jgi:hypothetical protein